MDVGEWLRGLGLERYEAAFRDNDIDAEVLPELTADDLIGLGVSSIGHRRKLLAAIAALGAREAPLTPSPRVTPHAAGPLSATTQPAEASTVGAEAERRQLTVMFCDLVGATEIAGRLDPEDLREVIAAYHGAASSVVSRFDGFVAKYMGAGVLAYFGYPRAHEDDAERAVRAGLGLVDAVGRLDVKSIKLQARIGIATGLVVVGDVIGEGSAQEQSVVGETPNLAARLQEFSDAGAVVVAEGTRRLIGGLFDLRDFGPQQLKGLDEPQRAWRVVGEARVASRFQALRGSALSRLVGREEEIDLLLRRWARAKASDGQIVLVSGEAGIGKSRIAEALAEQLRSEPHIRLRCFCSPHHQDSALFPTLDQLARAAGFARDDPDAVKLEKLEALLARVAPVGEDVALIADLLSLPASKRHPLPDLSPRRKKERTLEALIRQLEGLARQKPVLLVFEDAHWIDPTSGELLDLAVERVRTLPVLLIVTFRPEFQPPWTGQSQVTMVALNRLGRHDRTVLVDQVASGRALPDEVVAQIVERTDGVPLFVEELTKSVLESGLLREEEDRYVLDSALRPFAIPTTLHDSLMARLDRLASVRLVAQIGAAIGREFSYTLLHAVCGLREDELQTALARLVASELVLQRGTAPDAIYSFKHALVQDAAHGSLLRSSRQQLHARIAEALQTYSPGLADAQPELFAQHYAEAGLIEQSAASWTKAGHRSAGRLAMAEASAQLQKALDQLALLPDTRERRRHELELRSTLGAVLVYVKGFAGRESGQAYARARELWEQLGSPTEFLHIPYGQSRNHIYRGELERALRLDQDLLYLSLQRNDSAGQVLGHDSAGRDLLAAGRFGSSRSHLEAVLALYDPISHRSLVHQAEIHTQVGSRAYLGIVLFCLGYPEQALAQSSAAIAEARRVAHPPSLAASLAIGARLLSLAGDDTALNERADELFAVATERGFAFWGALGAIYCGRVKVNKGELAEGISLLRSGSETYRTSGAKLWMPHFIAFLASACESAGQLEEGLALLDEALQLTEKTGERWFAAELYRHEGRLLLRQQHLEAAERLYCKAVSIAQEQEAKLWELRAAASLARLWRDQGRRAEACDLLAPIYGWFTEGFDTPDLREARTLLAELH
jgi:class 3 adenylate cyclase/predicted ATPase